MKVHLVHTLCFFLSFLFCKPVDAQFSKEELQVRQCIQQLHDALIQKDSLALEGLLHEQLVYGHSNTWEENKKELIHNNSTGFMRYETLFMDSLRVQLFDETAIVRYHAFIRGKVNDKDFALSLHILQCWIREGKRWKLVARQGVRAPGS